MDVPTLQLIASSVLARTGLCIAGASFAIAFRQFYGFKPIVLVSGIGFHGGGNLTELHGANVQFEFWNRRKYPVKILFAKVTFDELWFERYVKEYDYDTKWLFMGEGKCYNPVSKVIEPNGHIEIAFKGPFKKRSLDALDDPLNVHMRYFDPAFGKAMSATANDRYKLNHTKTTT
jgi:hypothetical protein